MKYALGQAVLLICSVIFLYYLATLEYFLPSDRYGNPDWYNIITVLLLVFFATQSLISLVVFFIVKFLAYGANEYPPFKQAAFWGLLVGFLIVVALLLNILHFLELGWGIGISVVIVIGIILFK